MTDRKLTRRQFIGRSLLATGTPLVPFAASARKDDEELPPGGSAKRVIYLLMRGGMSPFETFNLKEAVHQTGSPVQIPTTIPGYSISEWLPKLANRMDHCAVIRSMSHQMGGHHADDGEYHLRTNYLRRYSIRHPAMSSWTSWHFAKKEKSHAVFQIGGDAETAEEWLGPEHAPMLIRHPGRATSEVAFRISGDELEQREKVWKLLNRIHGSASATGEFATGFALMRDGIEEIVDVTKAPPEDLARYGPDPFGLGCLIARRLAEADASRFTEVILDGWNPPAPYFHQVRERCAMLDKGLSALLDDLEKRDLLDETLVVVATPVGRSPVFLRGTRMEYPRAFSCVLAGGGVRGGQLHGKTDPQGRRPLENPVSHQALNRTIAWALGIDFTETAYSPSGRPFTMGGPRIEEKPLVELFETKAPK